MPPFDPSTARPRSAQRGRFDPSTARPRRQRQQQRPPQRGDVAETTSQQLARRREQEREDFRRSQPRVPVLSDINDALSFVDHAPDATGLGPNISGAGAYVGQLAENIGRRVTGRPVQISPDDAFRAAADTRRQNFSQFQGEHPGQAALATGAGIVGTLGAAAPTSAGLLPSMAFGAAQNTALNFAGGEGTLEERAQRAPLDAAVGAAVPLAFRAAGDLVNMGRSVYRNATGAATRAAHPLEDRFGRILTEGERSGNVGQRLEEDALRRGAGSSRSQAIMRGYDAQRAPMVREQLTNVATRGLPPLSQNADEAGVRLADELRNARGALHERQSRLYDDAFEAAKAEPVPPSDELPAAISAAEDANGFRVPSAARTEIDDLHNRIRRGTATQADVQRTRQRLNRLRTTAINARDDAAEFDISETINALDNWRGGLVRDPEARRLMEEADAVHREMRQLFAPQGRVGLSTGHTGRIDLGGHAVDRAINIEGESQILDAILGRGGAGSSQSALAAVRRIRQIGTGRIKYTNRSAQSGVRLPGRVSTGSQGTRGQSQLDMRLDAARRFAADAPDSPAAQRYFGGQVQQPEPVLQSLREGVIHRLSSNWDRYLRSVEDGVEAGQVPAQRLWRDLDTALNGSGAPVMREIFTERELATLREFQDFIKRMIPPAGVNASNTQIAISRAIQKGFDRLIGLIPGIGPVLRELGEQAGSVQAARRAIRPPGNPPPPITDNVPRRLQNIGGAFAGAAPPEWDQTLQDVTGVSALRHAGQDFSQGDYVGAGGNTALGLLAMTPALGSVGPLTRGASVGLGATILGAGYADAQEARNAEGQELGAVQAQISRLENEKSIFDEVNPADPQSVSAAQRVLLTRGIPVAVDGRLGEQTARAISQFREQVNAELAQARERRDELETAANARATAASPLHEAARELGPTIAGLGAAYVGHRTRASAIRRAASELAENNAAADALITGRGALRSRAASVNEFWRAGGAGERVPFQTSQNATGFRVRPNAAEASELFPPQPTYFRGGDYGAITAAGAEAGVSTVALQYAQDELRRAEEVAEQTPSRANLARVERARDLVSILTATQRAGAGFIVGRAGGALTDRYGNARPNVAAAESERMALQQRRSSRRRSRQ